LSSFLVNLHFGPGLLVHRPLPFVSGFGKGGLDVHVQRGLVVFDGVVQG
jgi:hypothetical protein